jgi:amino acid permease
VTAVVGVGILGLPYAFSYLTWSGGLVALGATTATSLYTAYLLAALHEDKDGRRHNRYRCPHSWTATLKSSFSH